MSGLTTILSATESSIFGISILEAISESVSERWKRFSYRNRPNRDVTRVDLREYERTQLVRKKSDDKCAHLVRWTSERSTAVSIEEFNRSFTVGERFCGLSILVPYENRMERQHESSIVVESMFDRDVE